MADLWMDVDVALAEVPVNLLPLLDATDFKTIEDAVAYNAGGLALFWHFVTPAGAYTVTAVTPTTAGDYDWTDQGASGVYTIEIPASGGASINNDTEGFGWFTGVATGVLPWRGPVIGFRAAGLNDALIEGAYSTTRGLAGTALPAAAADAAGGLIISDAGGLDADAQIVTKINSILDDTGTAGVLVSAGTGTGQLSLASGVVNANAVQVSGDSAAADALEAAFDGTVGAHDALSILDRGTLQSATATTAVLRAGAAFGDVLAGCVLHITGGTGVGQRKYILSYVGATDTATVTTWDVTPDATSTYQVYPSAEGATIADIAGGVLDEALSGHTTAGSLGKAVADIETDATAIVADTNELQTDWANGGRLDVILDARSSQTSVDDLPTNAELATALGTADDAVLAAVATVDTVVDAIKAKTDSLTFTVAGQVDANLQAINDVALVGDGSATPWGPA